MKYFKIGLVFVLVLIGYSHCMERKKNTEKKNNLATELLKMAEQAGVNFTINDLDVAESATNDAELTEVFPLPVAQKLISHRNRNELDKVREQMIGMIFTGEPITLGSFVTPTRRAFRTRPKKPQQFQPRFDTHDVDPMEILKPLPFVPEASNVKLPSPRLSPSEIPRVPLSHRPRKSRPRRPPSKSFRNRRPSKTRNSRPVSHFSSNNRLPPGRDSVFDENGYFSNTVGADFGPVTYETFGANQQQPDHFEPHQVNTYKGGGHHHDPSILSSFKPSEPVPASGFTTTKFGFTKKPNNQGHISNSKPNNQGHIANSKPIETNSGTLFGLSYSQAGDCTQYTEEICLDTDNYPHEAILSSLAHNPDRADNMMAEVRDQSADNLVDGLTAAQESKYDFSHYFGNRRQDSSKQSERDFASDGGYLCPSEVKYARPKRARNSKGNWKFIVNMDKYTQTIRMEKCMKPGGTCSYISHHYYAICNQIYNYQRLLSWEKHKGLHMDIYKVPSCCSCHIQGYAYIFPPLHNAKDGDFASSRKVEEVVKPPIRKMDIIPNISIKKSTKETDERGGHLKRKIPSIKTTPHRRQSGATKREKVRRRFDERPDINRQGNPLRINYGYHPIIDFFKQ